MKSLAQTVLNFVRSPLVWAQNAHFFSGYAITITPWAIWRSVKWTWIAAAVMLVWSALKECWFDGRYETETGEIDWCDLLFYCIGIGLALSLFFYSSHLSARPLNDSERDFAEKQAQVLAEELRDGDMGKLAARGDQALNRLVTVAINQLHRKGEHPLANQSEQDWNTHYRGYLSRGFQAGYGDIGDHKPLIQWLATFYDKLEAKLGVDLCKLLHLSDIKTGLRAVRWST